MKRLLLTFGKCKMEIAINELKVEYLIVPFKGSKRGGYYEH
jgi:hypothetical protein